MTQVSFTYRGKTDTVENIARTLIVAATVQPAGAVVYLPLSTEGAMHLGRAMEWALKVHEEHAAVLAAQTRISEVKVEVDARADRAEAALDRAVKVNRQAILYFFGGALWFTASLAFWWLA